MTKQEFLNELANLRNQYITSPKQIENLSVPKFLEAMSGFIADIEGFYQNKNQPVPEIDWQVFSDILKAASMYE